MALEIGWRKRKKDSSAGRICIRIQREAEHSPGAMGHGDRNNKRSCQMTIENELKRIGDLLEQLVGNRGMVGLAPIEEPEPEKEE